jgi:protein-S-isoprenylcysteine O-methyltransferase Ste14
MPEIAGRFVLFALIHSLLAANAVKDRVCRHRPINRLYRLSYNLLALGSFAWVLAALPDSPVLYSISGIPAVILRGFQAGALLLLCRCAAQTGLGDFIGISQLITGQENVPQFTRSGCYRVVRHPQYTIAVLFLLATPDMSANFTLFTILSIFYFVLGGYIEESRLRKLFGDDYRRYQAEVPMFVPRWSGLRPRTQINGKTTGNRKTNRK